MTVKNNKTPMTLTSTWDRRRPRNNLGQTGLLVSSWGDCVAMVFAESWLSEERVSVRGTIVAVSDAGTSTCNEAEEWFIIFRPPLIGLEDLLNVRRRVAEKSPSSLRCGSWSENGASPPEGCSCAETTSNLACENRPRKLQYVVRFSCCCVGGSVKNATQIDTTDTIKNCIIPKWRNCMQLYQGPPMLRP